MWTGLMFLPMLADSLLQAYTKWESKNLIRVTTGFLYGTAAMSFISLLGKGIGLWLKPFIFS